MKLAYRMQFLFMSIFSGLLFLVSTCAEADTPTRGEMLAFVTEGADKALSRITDARGMAVRMNGWPDGGRTVREFNWFWKDGKVFTVTSVAESMSGNGQALSAEEKDALRIETLEVPDMYARIGRSRNFVSILLPKAATQDRISEIFAPVNYGYKDAGLTLRQIVDQHEDNITIAKAMLGNKSVFLLTYITPVGKEVQVRKLWVDPDQGFAFIRREGMLPGIEYTAENTMRQNEAGVWFPGSGFVRQRELKDGEWVPTLSEEWQVTYYEVNVNLDDSIFTLPYHLLPGMNVSDQRFNPPVIYIYDDN